MWWYPKIINIPVVVPQIIDGVRPPQVFFPGKALSGKDVDLNIVLNQLKMWKWQSYCMSILIFLDTVMHLEECFNLLWKLCQHGWHFMLQWKLIWQFCYIFLYIIKTDLIMVHAEVWLISRQLLHFIVRGRHGCDRMRCMLRYD